MVTTQISSDSACKKLFRNNQRFAAFFNAIMFDGKQAIDYKTLQHQENDQSTFIDEALKEKIDIKIIEKRLVELKNKESLIGMN